VTDLTRLIWLYVALAAAIVLPLVALHH